MAKEVLFLVEDAVEGGYIARALGHSIFTEADTWEELKQAVRDAVHCHFDPGEGPDLIRLHAVREEVVAARGCHGTSVARSSLSCWGAMVMRQHAKAAATCA